MELSEIAAATGTVTTRQRDRGVVTVDGTDGPLAARLEAFDDELPCTAECAATIVQAYSDGADVEQAAIDAGVAPITGAKTLHRLGIEGLAPVGPTGRRIVRDWLRAELSRAEAQTLLDVDDAAFALAAYIESHDPIPAARAAVDATLAPRSDGTVAKRDRLCDAIDGMHEQH